MTSLGLFLAYLLHYICVWWIAKTMFWVASILADLPLSVLVSASPQQFAATLTYCQRRMTSFVTFCSQVERFEV